MDTEESEMAKSMDDLPVEENKKIRKRQWRRSKALSDMIDLLFRSIERNDILATDAEFMAWLETSCATGIFNVEAGGRMTKYGFTNLGKSLKPDSSKFQGMVPTNLLVSILHDTILCHQNMEIIRKYRRLIAKEKYTEASKGKCYYYMYHWGLNKVDEGPADYKKANARYRLLSPASVEYITSFAQVLVSKIHSTDDLDQYSIYPGILWTESAYHQRPHIDRDEGRVLHKLQSLVIHIPLSDEGMLLCTWDEYTEPRMQYTPFGCYSLLKNEQVHAGCYGNPGNLRFHLVLRKKMTEQAMQKDQLVTYDYRMLREINIKETMTTFNSGLQNYKKVWLSGMNDRHPTTTRHFMPFAHEAK